MVHFDLRQTKKHAILPTKRHFLCSFDDIWHSAISISYFVLESYCFSLVL